MFDRVVNSVVTFLLPMAETKPFMEPSIKVLFLALLTKLVIVARMDLALSDEVKLASMMFDKVVRVELASLALFKIFSNAVAGLDNDGGRAEDILSNTEERSVPELIAFSKVENSEVANVVGIDVFIKEVNAKKVEVTFLESCNSWNAGNRGAISVNVRLDSDTNEAVVLAGFEESARREKAVSSKVSIEVELYCCTSANNFCKSSTVSLEFLEVDNS